MKEIIKFLSLVFALLLLDSCSKTPSACFQILTPKDTIHVNQDVVFDGSCSMSTKEYNWSFDDDLIDYGAVVTHKFDSARTYNVELIVTNGNKTAATKKEIKVYP